MLKPDILSYQSKNYCEYLWCSRNKNNLSCLNFSKGKVSWASKDDEGCSSKLREQKYQLKKLERQKNKLKTKEAAGPKVN